MKLWFLVGFVIYREKDKAVSVLKNTAGLVGGFCSLRPRPGTCEIELALFSPWLSLAHYNIWFPVGSSDIATGTPIGQVAHNSKKLGG